MSSKFLHLNSYSESIGVQTTIFPEKGKTNSLVWCIKIKIWTHGTYQICAHKTLSVLISFIGQNFELQPAVNRQPGLPLGGFVEQNYSLKAHLNVIYYTITMKDDSLYFFLPHIFVILMSFIMSSKILFKVLKWISEVPIITEGQKLCRFIWLN